MAAHGEEPPREAGAHPDQRTRTVHWKDPTTGLNQALTMTGLEQVQALLAGTFPSPPIGELLGIYGVEAEEGRVVVAVEPAEFHANGTGAAHGGLAATLLDSAMWLAIHSTLPQGAFATTLQMNLHYARPLVLGGGKCIAEGTVKHRGRSVTTAEGVIRGPTGELCVHGSATCSITTL